MKKLENLLNKISYRMKYLRNNIWICEVISLLIVLLVSEIFGIFIAINVHNYLILSITTYIWVWMISEAFMKKIFFERFDLYLMKTPKATLLIFWMAFVVAVVLSWNYFAAFVFMVILAFIHADYNKTKKKMKKGE